MTIDDIKQLGFTLSDKLIDNVKCWYFVDNSVTNKILELSKKSVTAIDRQGEEYEFYDGYEERAYNDTIRVGKQALTNGQVHNTTELDAFNLETQNNSSNDEAAANSVINIKNITLEFNTAKYATPEFNTYFHEAIMPYLEQVIPSTAILTVKYSGTGTFATACHDATTPVITGVSN